MKWYLNNLINECRTIMIDRMRIELTWQRRWERDGRRRRSRLRWPCTFCCWRRDFDRWRWADSPSPGPTTTAAEFRRRAPPPSCWTRSPIRSPVAAYSLQCLSGKLHIVYKSFIFDQIFELLTKSIGKNFDQFASFAKNFLLASCFWTKNRKKLTRKTFIYWSFMNFTYLLLIYLFLQKWFINYLLCMKFI